MSSRDLILGRVRRALTDVRDDVRAGTRADVRDDVRGDARADGVPYSYDGTVERGYLREHGDRTAEQTVELLAENLADYRAIVHRAEAGQLPELLGRLLAERGSRSVLVPAALPTGWLPAEGPERVEDLATHTARELDEVDSVVTGCAVAVAETGTIVLDGGPDQGRRRVTLVPDHHICVVRVPDQVVASVPLALERLDPARPLTWISGPSATSDIELDRVEGVHGPRRLEVVLVSGV
ncbi:lactate utilization protein C [Streptomyces sp. NBC_01381]|uniref:LutC/YkgG family protein n=1 Tax=Streptomyces sp. NBC_01381 TaxID=2903845 RepID=UPI0022517701|nr:lactate utilization protein C [Streptomyces sp. NBC_01381]MCX4672154.1 lactate utilization protein C [Streptomyces sp. NBC_01381]